jgi:hypothetical protein
MITNRVPCLALLLFSAVTFAGCATQAEKPAGVVVSGAEYEYVTPLGSNIPVRVLKGTKPPTSSPSATISGDEASNLFHGAGGQAKVDKTP